MFRDGNPENANTPTIDQHRTSIRLDLTERDMPGKRTTMLRFLMAPSDLGSVAEPEVDKVHHGVVTI
jgi:hypothetical protein